MQLLQMSNLELSAAIERELEENPLLELDEQELDSQEPVESKEEDSDSNEDWDEDDYEAWENEQNLAATSSTSENLGDLEDLNPNESIEHEIEWDDQLEHLDLGAPSEYDDMARIEGQSRPESLDDHLQEQLDLAHCTEDEAEIARVVFDNLDSDGYIALGDAELLEEINLQAACTPDQLEDVLVLVQGFSPLGVCARNLQECLLAQVRACDLSKSTTRLALRIVRDHLGQLADRQIDWLSQELEVESSQLREAVDLIKRLNPKPAASYSNEFVEYIEPEARIVFVDGKWDVERGGGNYPSLKISSWYDSYRLSLSQAWKQQKTDETQKGREYVKEQHARAKLFMSGLRFRQLNIMRIIEVVVKWQQDYFNQGPSAMRPLILADVADELGLHASTVSRLTSRKYIQTSNGLLELKYFFTNRVGNQPGKEHSSMAIRAMMKEVIESEDQAKPLSDQKIADLLSKQNVDISRRTVTKYREAMSIPSGQKRKLLAQIEGV